MENRRNLLLIAVLFMGLLLWNAWQKQNTPPVMPVSQQSVSSNLEDETELANEPTKLSSAAITSNVIPKDAQGLSDTVGEAIKVRTDTLNISIDSLGGNITQASLPLYPLSINAPTVPYTLLSSNPITKYNAPSGLIGNYANQKFTTHVKFKTEQPSYAMTADQNSLVVPLTWEDQNGLVINKIFTFHRGSYVVDVNYQVINRSQQPWSGHFTAQLRRKPLPQKSSLFGLQSAAEVAYSSPEDRYQKRSFSKMKKEDLSQDVLGGWIAMSERYFLSAWIPPAQQNAHFFTQVDSTQDLYTIGLIGPNIQVMPNQQAAFAARLYIGPEDTETLQKIAPGLNLTVDYGWLWVISMALFWLMNQIHKFVGNWGFSIIIVTLLIKGVFYHLSAKSYRSMARMRTLQPKIQALRDQIGDDKQKLSQATMELYKKEKINPFGGCLPILVQIPVFIALYWVLIDSVELRQAPFILWIHDLSIKDPYYILPIIMGLTMLIQQKLNPPPPDPMQAKMMMFLPVVFTAFFLHFPAGLVLYWIVNNVVSILQQWYITRKYGQEPPRDNKYKRAYRLAKK